MSLPFALDCGGSLGREDRSTIDSFLGTGHTCKQCNALVEFCLNHLGLDYVLLGAFESDPIVSVGGSSAISVTAVRLAQTFVRRKLYCIADEQLVEANGKFKEIDLSKKWTLWNKWPSSCQVLPDWADPNDILIEEEDSCHCFACGSYL